MQTVILTRPGDAGVSPDAGIMAALFAGSDA
jgi:hypothetical protein